MDGATHRCLHLHNHDYQPSQERNNAVDDATNQPVIIDLCTPVRKQTKAQMPQPLVSPLERPPLQSTLQRRMAKLNADVAKSNVVASTHSQENTLVCPICMESCYKRKPTSTNCGHIFCQSCIHKALDVRSRCPKCNKILNRYMIFRIYLD